MSDADPFDVKVNTDGNTPTVTGLDSITQYPGTYTDKIHKIWDAVELLQDQKYKTDEFIGLLVSAETNLKEEVVEYRTSSKFIKNLKAYVNKENTILYNEFGVYIPAFSETLPPPDYDKIEKIEAALSGDSVKQISRSEMLKLKAELVAQHRKISRYQKFYAATSAPYAIGRMCDVKIPDLLNPAIGYFVKIRGT